MASMTVEELYERYVKPLPENERLRLVEITVREMANGNGAKHSCLHQTTSREEWQRAFDLWVASHEADGPLLSDEAVQRASFYGERG